MKLIVAKLLYNNTYLSVFLQCFWGNVIIFANIQDKILKYIFGED